MGTRVGCRHCSAAYATEATIAAVNEVGPCEECGVTALVVVEDEAVEEQADASQA